MTDYLSQICLYYWNLYFLFLVLMKLDFIVSHFFLYCVWLLFRCFEVILEVIVSLAALSTLKVHNTREMRSSLTAVLFLTHLMILLNMKKLSESFLAI